MAIDSRIALNLNPLNIGQRFAQNVQNLQQVDLLNQRREQAPLQNQLLQLQTELAQAQQPANLLQAERMASPLTQQLLTQQQLDAFDLSNAQALKPFLDSNDAQGAIAQLNRQKQQAKELGLADEVAEVDAAIQAIQSPEGFGRVKQATDSFLQLSSGIPQSQQKPIQFGAQQTFKDSEGNLFFGTQKRDPTTGDVATAFSAVSGDQSAKPIGQLSLVSGLGETAPEKQESSIRKGLLEDAAAVSKDAFEQLKPINVSISTIDEAIDAIDKGASSGFFEKFFPSFKESTIALENAAQRMGLDVISATTFGALSEGELKLAMDTARPSNMKPPELKRWLTERKAAKKKLAKELTKMAMTLGRGKTTIAEYLEKNAVVNERTDEDILSEYGL